MSRMTLGADGEGPLGVTELSGDQPPPGTCSLAKPSGRQSVVGPHCRPHLCPKGSLGAAASLQVRDYTSHTSSVTTALTRQSAEPAINTGGFRGP